jgi:hypothetical protein
VGHLESLQYLWVESSTVQSLWILFHLFCSKDNYKHTVLDYDI